MHTYDNLHRASDVTKLISLSLRGRNKSNKKPGKNTNYLLNIFILREMRINTYERNFIYMILFHTNKPENRPSYPSL